MTIVDNFYILTLVMLDKMLYIYSIGENQLKYTDDLRYAFKYNTTDDAVKAKEVAMQHLVEYYAKTLEGSYIQEPIAPVISILNLKLTTVLDTQPILIDTKADDHD